MIKKVWISLLILWAFNGKVATAASFGVIEIFDINNETVEKIIPVDYEVQKLTENYIYGISGLYPKFNPIPDSGFAVKVPLAPAVRAEVTGKKMNIDQVIIMFPENEKPFLLIFEEDDKLSCFNFKGDKEFLLESLEYEPKVRVDTG
ncbi:hypothetical protein [Clostridium thermarum]|uniref:hypothetical protein n=1 Tax=Clostridium thermarum TaxID=1716543 RepID=UPI001124BFC5|nr:hypothetical protein [Clostridium thermarum]